MHDKVTGLSGVCTSVAFDLFGCITVLVNPGLDDHGKPKDQQWLDISRVVTRMSQMPSQADFRVMEAPDYMVSVEERIVTGMKGASDKPIPNKI